ncbi:SCO family protein [Brevundimonas sp. Root1423]|uniref:SCO family protein n=1 Tax=Brevundimonas sp. Root1423 TaxID=1736462 RepID=UPI0006F9F5CF|nr:SCO family protein [Brevundimonas sp. Root1423]KQY89964.1 photosynthetic protein synthase I [Brevundimonas sp. Root1423]
MPRRSILLFAGACIAFATAIAVSTIVVVNQREGAIPPLETSTGQPSVGGPFQLVNQEGQPVDQTMLDGKWSLVFFGFTYCPDFCPTTLTALEATKQQMGAKAKDVQIIFVSVDPERDTPQALKDYLSSEGFPRGVIGLTGSQEQVKAAADAYRAYYQKVGEAEGYTMNHSLTVYLMGPDGKFRTALAHDLGPERAAQLIERTMARG